MRQVSTIELHAEIVSLRREKRFYKNRVKNNPLPKTNHGAADALVCRGGGNALEGRIRAAASPDEGVRGSMITESEQMALEQLSRLCGPKGVVNEGITDSNGRDYAECLTILAETSLKVRCLAQWATWRGATTPSDSVAALTNLEDR